MIEYSCGFTLNQGRVALIVKKRGPEGVINKINGIGGHLEEGESPVQCQRREFHEETGVDISEGRWEHTLSLSGPQGGGWVVYFFRAYLDDDEFEHLHTVEDEEVLKIPLEQVPFHLLVSNLRWIIPLYFSQDVEFPVTVSEREL